MSFIHQNTEEWVPKIYSFDHGDEIYDCLFLQSACTKAAMAHLFFLYWIVHLLLGRCMFFSSSIQ